MTACRDGIVVRVRRRPADRPRLLIEIARARDELLARARRARGHDDAYRAAALREAADLIAAAIDRANEP